MFPQSTILPETRNSSVGISSWWKMDFPIHHWNHSFSIAFSTSVLVWVFFFFIWGRVETGFQYNWAANAQGIKSEVGSGDGLWGSFCMEARKTFSILQYLGMLKSSPALELLPNAIQSAGIHLSTEHRGWVSTQLSATCAVNVLIFLVWQHRWNCALNQGLCSLPTSSVSGKSLWLAQDSHSAGKFSLNKYLGFGACSTLERSLPL